MINQRENSLKFPAQPSLSATSLIVVQLRSGFAHLRKHIFGTQFVLGKDNPDRTCFVQEDFSPQGLGACRRCAELVVLLNFGEAQDRVPINPVDIIGHMLPVKRNP
jgi:hypothetical protein